MIIHKTILTYIFPLDWIS